MYKRRSLKWLKHGDFLILDLICLCLSLMISYRVYYPNNDFWNIIIYRQAFISLILIDITVTYLNETYRNVLKRTNQKEFRISIRHWLLIFSIFMLFLFVLKQTSSYSRQILLMFFVTYTISSYIVRYLYKKFRINRSGNGKKLLVISTADAIEEDIRNIKEHNWSNYNLYGCVLLDESKIGEKICDVEVVSDEKNILEYISTHWIDEVYFGDYIRGSEYKPIIKGLVNAGITTHLALKYLDEFAGSEQFMEKIGNEWTVTSAISTLTNSQVVAKRLLDLLVGIVGSVITLLLCPFIAYKIKKADPGKLFYTSTRIGQNGKPFKMYKFRSMINNADQLKQKLIEENGSDGYMFKMEHDPRIIGGENGIGEFIRKTSLDEFPQFFNVVLGQMSVVGTRPPTPDEWAKYEPYHRSRLSGKPGVTGLWQISGRSDITDFDEVVRLDREYIQNWSLLGDLKIILKTILVVLNRKGSY